MGKIQCYQNMKEKRAIPENLTKNTEPTPPILRVVKPREKMEVIKIKKPKKKTF